MSWTTVLWIAVPAALVLAFLRSRARYYRRFFAPAHLEETYQQFVLLVDRLDPDEDEPPDEPPVVLTSAQLVIVATHTREDDGRACLHVSISQEGGPTTLAVASRIGFLLLATLADNDLEITPFHTQSRVFHLRMLHREPHLQIRPLAMVMADLRERYEPVRYEYRPMADDSVISAPG